MVMSSAKTVEDYLDELPEERRKVVSAVRTVVRKNMPRGFAEGMSSGMIGYHVPLARYPKTYNGQPLSYVSLAAQKNNYALYLVGCSMDAGTAKRLAAALKKAGKKLDMGKSCLRFASLDDLPLEAIAEVVAAHSVEDFIALYERSRR